MNKELISDEIVERIDSKSARILELSSEIIESLCDIRALCKEISFLEYLNSQYCHIRKADSKTEV